MEPNKEQKAVQVATSETARDINRRAVLNLIRTRQPVSRAELARLSGLQRSTISLIVEQLIAEHWVLEGSTVRLPRGRHPTFLTLNRERAIVGVDIRPTQMTLVLSDVNGQFLSHQTAPTPPDPAEALQTLIAILRGIIASAKGMTIEGVGISVPGRLDPGGERLVFAPNLGWRDCDLRTPIAQATGLDVQLENAANACVLATVWFDHVENRDLLVITVSEGIGAGVLANGQLVRGQGGMAGEFGHVPLDPEGPLCGCGGRGCWEVFASNRAALRYYGESGAETSGVTYTELMARAAGGETAALAALERQAHALGKGMRIIVAGLAPERILLVGDLTGFWTLFGPILQQEVLARVLPGTVAPLLEPAGQDELARLRGTVALVLQKHFQHPFSDTAL
jgi:predicted NBD/HSP70 family sugar kinase